MNLQQLKSLAAILECQSLSQAANKIGLSHSAISLQISALEEEFGRPLFDRTTRPAKLVASGKQAAQMAQKILRMIDELADVAAGKAPLNTIALGMVPTTLQEILPFILKQIQLDHRDIQLNVKSGLSGDLTSQVLNGDLDMAIVTSPVTGISDLQIHEIATEPLYAIGDKSILAQDDAELLQSRPFISFSRKTWLGQQISARLQARGIFVNEIMEINSLDAIERMVGDGFGVSIVPQRLLAKPLSEKLYRLPFCQPQEVRRLVLVSRIETAQALPLQLVLKIVSGLRNTA